MSNLIEDIIISYNEYLDRIPNGINQIIENLRDDNIGDALSLILEFSEGIQWLSQVNAHLMANSYDSNLDENVLKRTYIELNEGLEIKDFLLVADLFEYEIGPYFEKLNIIEYRK